MELIEQLRPFWFPVESLADDPAKPSVQLRPVDAVERLDILNGVSRDGDILTMSGEAIEKALRYGVTDWKGVTDKGQDVPYSLKLIRVQFSSEAIKEIAYKVILTGMLEEGKRKNSSSQSAS